MPAQGSIIGYIEETVVASAARTVTGNSGILTGWGGATTLRAQLEVTAAGAGDTLDVVIQDTLDGTNFNTLIAFTQATGATREVKNLTTPFADRVRVLWTIAGNGSETFTFSVKVASQSPLT